MKKNRVREKHKKRAGTGVQGILETKMEVAESENDPLNPHRFSLYYALTVECTNMK